MDNISSLSRAQTFLEKNYESGIARRKTDKGFSYYYIKTGRSVSQNDLDRIKKLKIPPAWEDVWVSGSDKSSIQVIGVDKKGRMQYRYHKKHIEKAEMEKFIKMLGFIKAIPKLEKVMYKHENLNPYDKERVIASMLKIIKEVHMRVGKEVYARKHRTYGVSSLKKVHMRFEGNKVVFNFKGKAGKRVTYTIEDPVLQNHLKLLLRLEGDKLFQYIDENDKVRKVTDADINKYLQKYMGKEYTAKDFRTYAANHYFIKAILDETKKRLPKNSKIIKKNILNALKRVAFYLRHTRSVSKRSYVMNFTINKYMENPDYFVERRDNDPDDVLLDILKLYKKTHLKKN